MDERISKEEWDAIPFSKQDRNEIISHLRDLDCGREMKNSMYRAWMAKVKKERWDKAQKEGGTLC